jgi:hypothetical protein
MDHDGDQLPEEEVVDGSKFQELLLEVDDTKENMEKALQLPNTSHRCRFHTLVVAHRRKRIQLEMVESPVEREDFDMWKRLHDCQNYHVRLVLVNQWGEEAQNHHHTADAHGIAPGCRDLEDEESNRWEDRRLHC